MNREQRIQAICVLWRNAVSAVGRPEPLSAAECVSIQEDADHYRRAKLAELGVRILEEDDVVEDYVYVDAVREAIEIGAFTFRYKLIEELVQLEASKTAATLISELPEDDRRVFWKLLVEDLTMHGDFCAAREAADAYFSNDADCRLSLRVEIYRHDPNLEELPLLRAIAGRTVEASADFPPAAVAAFLKVWVLSSDPADLEAARALCRDFKPGFRLMAYTMIAKRTGLVSDFLIAFRFAGRFSSKQARAEGVIQLFEQVWVARKCDVYPGMTEVIFKGTCPLGREDAVLLLDELEKLSPQWAGVLRKMLKDSDLL